MASTNSSDNSSINENNTTFRRRKHYINCSYAQQKRNKHLISLHLENLAQFCKSIGFKIDEIILSPNIDNSQIHNTKIVIQENVLSTENKVFKCLMAKDITNLSCRKYSLLIST